MALSDVLSAMRVLLLDSPALPADDQQRKKWFESTFPRLSPEEIEDLSQISPERFELYRGTIFAGERTLLKNHFPVTFSLLSSRTKERNGKNFNALELVKDLHKKRPWKANTTAALASNFVDYLSSDRADLMELVPEISDISRLEIETLRISRSDAPEGEENHLTTISQIDRMSVEELLELQFRLGPTAQLEEFTYDVLTLRSSFYQHHREVPSTPTEKKKLWVVGARDRTLHVKWLSITDEVFELLSASKNALNPLYKLAGAVASSLTDEQSEKEQFQEFLRITFYLVQSGAIVVLL